MLSGWKLGITVAILSSAPLCTNKEFAAEASYHAALGHTAQTGASRGRLLESGPLI